MPAELRSWRTAAVLGLIAGLLACLGAIQVRSQAEVARSLAQEDSTSLAFLIDDLHRSNESLAAEQQVLADRRDALAQGGDAAVTDELQAEINQLEIVEGLVPVRGSGVTIKLAAPLTTIDLDDIINNLRIGGAEAIAINDQRVVTGTLVSPSGRNLLIDGVAVDSPWTVQAVGDPARLLAAATQMTESLRSDSRVTSAYYQPESDLQITAVARPRHFTTGRPG